MHFIILTVIDFTIIITIKASMLSVKKIEKLPHKCHMATAENQMAVPEMIEMSSSKEGKLYYSFCI